MWVRVALRYKPRPHPRSSRTSNFRSECLNAGFPPFFCYLSKTPAVAGVVFNSDPLYDEGNSNWHSKSINDGV